MFGQIAASHRDGRYRSPRRKKPRDGSTSTLSDDGVAIYTPRVFGEEIHSPRIVSPIDLSMIRETPHCNQRLMDLPHESRFEPCDLGETFLTGPPPTMEAFCLGKDRFPKDGHSMVPSVFDVLQAALENTAPECRADALEDKIREYLTKRQVRTVAPLACITTAQLKQLKCDFLRSNFGSHVECGRWSRQTFILVIGALMSEKVDNVVVFTGSKVHAWRFQREKGYGKFNQFVFADRRWMYPDGDDIEELIRSSDQLRSECTLFFFVDGEKTIWLRPRSNQRRKGTPNDTVLRVLSESATARHAATIGFANTMNTSQQPPLLVKTWFVSSLVLRNTARSSYVGRTDDILSSEKAVDMLFQKYWNACPQKFYSFLGCWLPDLASFERQDGLEAKVALGMIHDNSEREEIMISFGIRRDGGFNVVNTLKSTGRSFDSCASEYFLQYSVRECPTQKSKLVWWPHRVTDEVCDLVQLIVDEREKFLALERCLEATRTVKSPYDFETVVSETYKAMKKSLGLHYNTGASIYAEPTEASSINLSLKIGELAGEDFSVAMSKQEVLFMDLGAGTSTFITSLARPRNCPALAIEYCKVRCQLALDCLTEVNAQPTESYPYKVAYLPMDIFDLTSLEPPSGISKLVVYLGDEAFSESLMDKIASLLLEISVELILVTDKAGRHKCFDMYWESKGPFERLGALGWKKRGGNNEPGTFFIFRLRPTSPRKRNVDERIARALRHCGNSASVKERMWYYLDTLKRIKDGTYPSKLFGTVGARSRCATSKGECVSFKTLRHCGSAACATCKRTFLHCPGSVLVARSSIDGLGLFAKKNISKGKFIVHFGGWHAVGGVSGPNIVNTDVAGRIDVSRCLHHECRHINHGCDPNAAVRIWEDKEMVTRSSIVAMRDIEKGEEVLVRYDSCDFVCNCPTCDLMDSFRFPMQEMRRSGRKKRKMKQ